jgi:hypothetical protein
MMLDLRLPFARPVQWLRGIDEGAAEVVGYQALPPVELQASRHRPIQDGPVDREGLVIGVCHAPTVRLLRTPSGRWPEFRTPFVPPDCDCGTVPFFSRAPAQRLVG